MVDLLPDCRDVGELLVLLLKLGVETETECSRGSRNRFINQLDRTLMCTMIPPPVFFD